MHRIILGLFAALALAGTAVAQPGPLPSSGGVTSIVCPSGTITTTGNCSPLAAAGTSGDVVTAAGANGIQDSAVALANVGQINVAATWAAVQTFTNSDLKLLGSSTGATTFTSANAGTTNYTITFPALTDTVDTLTETATLANKTLTSPILTTPSLGVATATSIAIGGATLGSNALAVTGTSIFSGAITPTGGIVGASTNSSPAAGLVGEPASSTVLVGSAVSFASSGTAINVTSLSLTAGNWLIMGNVCFNADGSTIVASEYVATSTTSATFPTSPAGGYSDHIVTLAAGAGECLPLAPQRISLASTTPEYLVANAVYSVSTLSAFGKLEAVRLP